MNIVLALFGGILSFISPCVLPLIPVYLAYISGVSAQELAGTGDGAGKKPVGRILANSTAFVLGFTVVFTVLAALFYIFARFLGRYKIWFDRGAGVLLVVFGLNMMGVIRIPFLNYEARYNKEIRGRSLLGSFFVGMAFGAGWTPCIGPILSGILFTAAGSASPARAVILLVVYSLGLGIPFVLTGLLTNLFLGIFAFIRKHYRVIETVGGVFLIMLGVLLFFGGTGALSGFFSRLIPDITILIEKNILK